MADDLTTQYDQKGQAQDSSNASSAMSYGGLIGGLAAAGFSVWTGLQAVEARHKAEMEEKRRREAAAQQVEGAAQASEGASGTVFGASSMSRHIAAMTAAFRQDAQWRQDQADQERTLATQATYFNGASNVGSSLFRFGQSNNWWQDEPQVK